MNRLCIIASNSILQKQPPMCASARTAANYYEAIISDQKIVSRSEKRVLCNFLLNAVIACSPLVVHTVPLCYKLFNFAFNAAGKSRSNTLLDK